MKSVLVILTLAITTKISLSTVQFSCMTGGDSYCRQCNPNLGCVLCIGSYPVNGECSKVPPATVANCLSYLSGTQCGTCKPGFYLSGNTCVALPTNCIQADANGFCTACAEGFAINASNICDSRITAPFMNCMYSGRGSCLQCKAGYVLSSGGCIMSQNNLSGCLEVRTGGTSCDRCLDGYFINYNSGSCSYSSNASASAAKFGVSVVIAAIAALLF